eukprot:18341-Rhodomonas_salina.3
MQPLWLTRTGITPESQDGCSNTSSSGDSPSSSGELRNFSKSEAEKSELLDDLRDDGAVNVLGSATRRGVEDVLEDLSKRHAAGCAANAG